MDANAKPTVYVIAGPNGAGKTTFATKYLPNFVNCTEFLNADLIAWGLSPFAAEKQNMRAGRLLLERVEELAVQGISFGFETTLAGRAYSTRLNDLKNRGYRIDVFFLWLPDADLAVTRVANRVLQGGHNVPEADIRRRYIAGIDNLLQLYRPIADDLWLYDASMLPPKLFAKKSPLHLTIVDTNVYDHFSRSCGAL
jgi:predicted ABC-type ATPase